MNRLLLLLLYTYIILFKSHFKFKFIFLTCLFEIMTISIYLEPNQFKMGQLKKQTIFIGKLKKQANSFKIKKIGQLIDEMLIKPLSQLTKKPVCLSIKPFSVCKLNLQHNQNVM